jgi:hypothetical protein
LIWIKIPNWSRVHRSPFVPGAAGDRASLSNLVGSLGGHAILGGSGRTGLSPKAPR